jgi:transketolase
MTGLPGAPALADVARRLRVQIIQNSHRTGTPHLASCLSCVDILVALYWSVLRVGPANAAAMDRDRFLLSKGHAAPALFFTLAERNFFPRTLLDDYGEDGSLFGEHPPAPGDLPGIEAATGSLGHGLPVAIGMALSSRLSATPYRVVALLGDGECNEGSVWEGAMFAGAQKLSNLAVVVDFNKWQATGRSREVMAIDPLAEKWRAFGWRAVEVDGHDPAALVAAFAPVTSDDRPLAIVAHTVKGRGVSFMEDDNNWHYKTPSEDELARAMAELGKAA